MWTLAVGLRSPDKHKHTHPFECQCCLTCKSLAFLIPYQELTKASSFTGILAAGEHSFPFQFLIPGEYGIDP